jgi:hypothetical protein
MSIHIELSSEAKAALARQRKQSAFYSLLISALVICCITLVLGLFMLPSLVVDVPVIVTYQEDKLKDESTEVKKVKTLVQKKPTAPSSQTAKVIVGSAASLVSIPTVDIPETPVSIEFGGDQDFGQGWDNGMDLGSEGGGAVFF